MKAFILPLILLYLLPASLVSAQESSSGADAGGGGVTGFPTGSSGDYSAPSGVGIVVGENYILKSSDVVSLDVYQEADLRKSVRIEGDGSIDLPLIGKVKVAGMTVSEAKSLVTDLYGRDYLVNPQVSLLVIQFSPKIVRVLGNVNRPGVVRIPPDRDLTLTEALAGVGGVSRLGNPKAIEIKRIEKSGRARQMKVNFSEIVTNPDVEDVILEAGDTIWVPERWV